jgi:hypothetical protein
MKENLSRLMLVNKKYFVLYFLCIIPLLQLYSQNISLNDFAYCAYNKINKINKINLTNEEISNYLSHEYEYGYNQSKTDEFKHRAYINEMSNKFRQIIDTINTNNTFTFKIKVGIGDYDFEKKSFPLRIDKYINKRDLFSWGFVYMPINLEEYSLLPIDSEKAQILIKQIELNNKPQYYSVGMRYWTTFDKRQVIGIVKFRLTGETDSKEYDIFTTVYGVACKIEELYLIDKGIAKISIHPVK